MKSSRFGHLGLALLLVLGMLFVYSKSATAAPKTLRINAGVYASNSIPGETLRWMADEITKRTNGQIKFSFTWTFSLTSPGEEIDSVASGLSDLVFTPVGYYPTKLLLNNFSYATFGSPSDLAAGAWKIVDTLYKEEPSLSKEYEKYGVKLLWVALDPADYIHSRMPIHHVADLKGKKIGATGFYNALYLKAAGASPMPTTVVDRASQLQTGAIDGSQIPLTTEHAFKHYDFAKYAVPTNKHLGPLEVCVMNPRVFNALPEDIKKIFVDVSREASMFFRDLTIRKAKEWEEDEKKGGVTFAPGFTREDLVTWAKMMNVNPVVEFVKQAEQAGLPGRQLINKYFELVKASGYVLPRDWMADLK